MATARPGAAGREAGAARPALNRERLLRSLPLRRRLATRIEIVEECASTSDALRQRLDRDGAAACAGLLLAAEHQSGGRGRSARDWWSGPPRSNLAVSLAVAPPPEPTVAGGLLAACALARALRPWTGATVALKWPNDLLLDGAKVAGVLAEAPARAGAETPCLLLGLGVNVLAAPPPEVAPYPTTALVEQAPGPAGGRAERRRPPDRTALLASWLWELEKRLLRFERGGPRSLETEFLALLLRWAPGGVRAVGGDRPLPDGPLRDFSLEHGLTWGPESAPATCPLGWLPSLEALSA